MYQLVMIKPNWNMIQWVHLCLIWMHICCICNSNWKQCPNFLVFSYDMIDTSTKKSTMRMNLTHYTNGLHFTVKYDSVQTFVSRNRTLKYWCLEIFLDNSQIVDCLYGWKIILIHRIIHLHGFAYFWYMTGCTRFGKKLCLI